MCWHTVTLCLNLKLFFLIWKQRRKRWIYGAAAACPGYCESAAFWSCQSVLRPRVWAGTLSGFTPVRGAELLTASAASPQKNTGAQLLVVTFLHPTSSLFLPYPFLIRLLLTPHAVTWLTDRQSDCSSVGPGVLCFLFMNGDFVGGIVPPRRYLDDKVKRLVPFTKYYHSERKTFVGKKEKKGVF